MEREFGDITRINKKIWKCKSELLALEKKKELKELQSEVRKKKEELSSVGKVKKITTSKLILLVVISIVLEIVLFAQYEMNKLGDLTPMYSLIGVVGVLAPVIKHYYLKATQENTKGGVVYDNMINSFQETTKSEIEEDCNNVESLG